jgi:hypothetical protein
MSEGRGEMQGLPQAPKGPLVKLLVEGFHSPCTAFVWSSGAIVSIVTLLHSQPSISLALRAPHVRGRGEMQGLPQTRPL